MPPRLKDISPNGGGWSLMQPHCWPNLSCQIGPIFAATDSPKAFSCSSLETPPATPQTPRPGLPHTGCPGFIIVNRILII
jgi:hypothetical protein